jgi:hypothetical protein
MDGWMDGWIDGWMDGWMDKSWLATTQSGQNEKGDKTFLKNIDSVCDGCLCLMDFQCQIRQCCIGRRTLAYHFIIFHKCLWAYTYCGPILG